MVENKHEEQSLNRYDAIGSQRNLLGYENKCTRLWNPEYGKLSIMESGIHPTIGIRIQVLLTNTGLWYLESGIHSEESESKTVSVCFVVNDPHSM